jgi:hypothetical protein
MNTEVDVSGTDEAAPRLEELIGWYEREARKSNIGHKSLRITSIAAAAQSVLAAASAPPWPCLPRLAIVALGRSRTFSPTELGGVRHYKEALKRSVHHHPGGSITDDRGRGPDRVWRSIKRWSRSETTGWADVRPAEVRLTTEAPMWLTDQSSADPARCGSSRRRCRSARLAAAGCPTRPRRPRERPGSSMS